MDTAGLLQAGFVHQYGDMWRCFLTPCTLIAIALEHANSAVFKVKTMEQTKAFYVCKDRNAMSQRPSNDVFWPYIAALSRCINTDDSGLHVDSVQQ